MPPFNTALTPDRYAIARSGAEGTSMESEKLSAVTAAVLADAAFEAVGEATKFSTLRYREIIEQIRQTGELPPARREPDRFMSRTDYLRDRANRFRDLAGRAEAAEDGWYLLLMAAEADLEVYMIRHAAPGDSGS
jgi:hypothetical protein